MNRTEIRLRAVRKEHNRLFKQYMKTRPASPTDDLKKLRKQEELAERLAELTRQSRELVRKLKLPIIY